MKAKKKPKGKIYKGQALNEVTVTPYTKNKYELEERLSNKAKGNVEPSYPVFDGLLGRSLMKPLKKGAKSIVKKAFGKATKKKASPKKVIKYRAGQAGLTAKDINEYIK